MVVSFSLIRNRIPLSYSFFLPSLLPSFDTNRYVVLETVGKGGSSKVFKVLSADLKIYALKQVFLDRADPSTIENCILNFHFTVIKTFLLFSNLC